MIQVQLRLYGILRDKLPEEAKGYTLVEIPAGSTMVAVKDRLQTLGIRKPYRIAHNGAIANLNDRTILTDGDQIDVFRSASGG